MAADVLPDWKRLPIPEPELERLIQAQWAEDDARRTGCNYEAATEEVRRAQIAVDLIKKVVVCDAIRALLGSNVEQAKAMMGLKRTR
jgi:hypothetical protein